MGDQLTANIFEAKIFWLEKNFYNYNYKLGSNLDFVTY